MAGYCHGRNAPYGCGHHAEHVAAANKGWITRRKHSRGASFEGSEDQYYASAFTGGKISYAHTHAEHPNRVVFQQNGKWYELPRRTFQSFVKGGREMERDEEKQRKQQQKSTRDQLKERILLERQGEAYSRSQRAEVVKFIMGSKGIAPDKKVGRYKGNRDEWLSLPAQVRNTKSHFKLDQVAEHVADAFPELRIESGDDLIRFFEREDYRRREAAGRRRSLQQQLAQVTTPRRRRAS